MLPCPSRPARSGVGTAHAAELRAGDAGNAVVPGELLVQERVVGIPELDRIAVVAQLTEEEQLGFRGHRVAQRDVVVGEVPSVRIGLAELIESQPREEEARDEGLGAIVGEHALDLPLEGRRDRSGGCAAHRRRSDASGALFHNSSGQACRRSPGWWRLPAAAHRHPSACSMEASTRVVAARSGRGAPTGGIVPACSWR